MNSVSVICQSLKSGSRLSVRGRQLGDQPVQPADGRLLEREVRHREGAGHRDAELDEVDDQHAPEPGDRGEADVEAGADQQRLPHRPAEHDVGDLGGGEVDRRHDEAVEEQAQVDRRGSRAPSVAARPL